MIWKRYTLNAKHVILEAQTLAYRHGTPSISGLCILYGILKVPGSTGCQLMVLIGYDPDLVMRAIDGTFPEKEGTPMEQEMSLDKSGKRIIERSYDFYRLWRGSTIGTEHFLAALASEEDGPLADIFARHSVTPDLLLQLVIGDKPKTRWEKLSDRISKFFWAGQSRDKF